MTSTTGSLVGPMLGGLIVGWWGYRAAYGVDAVTFTAALYAMWRLPAMLPERGGETGKKRASVLDGLRFLGTRPNLRMTFLSDMCAMVLAQPRALFPVVAVLWYGGDARTTGLLVAAPALGALLGGVFSGWLGSVRRHGLAVLVAVGCWGAAVAVFGLTRQLWLGLVFLALAGAADTTSMVFRNTMLQAAVPDELRGRLQGVFIVVVAAWAPAGGLHRRVRRRPDLPGGRRHRGRHRLRCRGGAARAAVAGLRPVRRPPPRGVAPATTPAPGSACRRPSCRCRSARTASPAGP